MGFLHNEQSSRIWRQYLHREEKRQLKEEEEEEERQSRNAPRYRQEVAYESYPASVTAPSMSSRRRGPQCSADGVAAIPTPSGPGGEEEG